MLLAVKADTTQRAAFLWKGIPEEVQIVFLDSGAGIPVADAYFDLLWEEEGPAFPDITAQPVFVNAVITTSESLPANQIRLNCWPGFLERSIIEIASVAGSAWLQKARTILDALQWKYCITPDIPGMIAPGIIAMIINEAYFGLGDEISTRAEIDTAMKLGTNYPYGPFEWGGKIGLEKIYNLLQKLAATQTRYTPAPKLVQEIHLQ